MDKFDIYKKQIKNLLNIAVISIKNPYYIKKFLKIARKEGINVALDKAKRYISPVYSYKPILLNIDKYEKISFPKNQNPLVSIIIPVHNKFDFTYKCLYSLYKYTYLSKIEIIIGDDASTDQTKDIKDYVEGINVVRNEPPLGFLKNCNKCAKLAKGEYLLFLNNDTQVQPKWLDYLIDTIKSDENIGLVGPKLVYPNGKLQEAGIIVWKDGTGWNFGKEDDPEKPEYNYVKEVDYISGACILLKKELWDKIGGFDERFAPAYYEDTDLSFNIRKHGFKVIYQPKSIVVHFEGISHGKDINTGFKRYQEINRPKFVEKWKDILEKEHFEHGEHPFLARDKTKDKKHILIIDHHIPFFDKDAGSKAMFLILKALKELDTHISFIGDDFNAHEPYTSILQQMGIEVIYGEWYMKDWKNFFISYLKYFDFIILSRNWVAKRYINTILKYKNKDAKIIYYPHDLSFLRLEREYAITKDRTFLKEAKESKKLEFDIINKSDIIVVLSFYEEEYLKKEFKDKTIYTNIPFVYDKEFPISKNNYEDRKDIMFVGGFLHRPNYDGIKWFLDNMWHEIKSSLKDVNLYIVGSNTPEDIKNYNLLDKSIKPLGYVKEDDLQALYNNMRLIIAPLRYGAGLKGKVIEAIAQGVPIITTDIGKEGISDESTMLTANDEKSFIKATIDLYTNKSLWENIRQNQIKYANENLSYKGFKDFWKSLIMDF